MAPRPQSFSNHARVLPEYHVGVFVPFALNFVWAAYQLVATPGMGTVIQLLTAVGLLLMFASVRRQVLTVQDRVIRLEMRLRLREVLPPELQPAIPELSVRQLIALRFASDAELPELVREIRAGRLATARDIKMRVRDWQPDYLRA